MDLLHVELQIGLVFAKAALSADPYQRDEIEHRNRNARNAWKAYDTFVRFRGRGNFVSIGRMVPGSERGPAQTGLLDLEGLQVWP